MTGVEPGRESAILNLEGYMVEGSVRLGSGLIVCSVKGWPMICRSGSARPLRLQSSAGVSAVLTLAGVLQDRLMA